MAVTAAGQRERGGRDRRWGRRRARASAAGIALAAALFLAAVPVGAEAEWCDTGSPPPNDFRLQPTGERSAGSEPNWLRSTDNGGDLLTTYETAGEVDVSQVSTLEGGVANGMTHATAARAG
ncbi:MAG: hypothetical protein ACRDJN_23020 [Chloroflexota bacterium]